MPFMPRRTETPQNSDSLRKIADRLDRCSSEVRAVAEMLASQQIETLVVGNYPSLVLGLKNAELFARGARLALMDEIEKRGGFRAPGDKGRKRS